MDLPELKAVPTIGGIGHIGTTASEPHRACRRVGRRFTSGWLQLFDSDPANCRNRRA